MAIHVACLRIHFCVTQICRLRSELDIVRGNTKVMSEMLTEMVPGQEDTSDYELLQARNHLSVCLCLSFCRYVCLCLYSEARTKAKT